MYFPAALARLSGRMEQATESGSRALRARQVLLTGCFALGNSFASVSQFPSRGLRSSLPSSPCFGGESLFAHAYRTHQFGLVNTSIVSERPPMAPVQDLIAQAHVQFPRLASERLVAKTVRFLRGCRNACQWEFRSGSTKQDAIDSWLVSL
jgi:hypothetical protein